MSISTPQRPSMRSTDPADRMSHEAAQNPSERQAFLLSGLLLARFTPARAQAA
jgi:hypothetical protein